MEKGTQNLKTLLLKYKEVLGANDFSFLNRVYEADHSVYSNRLKAIGFENMERVLDAGCGFGQWTMALASANKKVEACDLSAVRLLATKEIANHFGHKNVNVKNAGIENTEYKKNYFDGVFCFGAIFLSDPAKALNEFYRILKPGGTLYANANGLGWSINLWMNQPHLVKDYNPKWNVAKAFQNTVNLQNGLPKGEGQVIIEKEEFSNLCREAGFKKIILKGDGKINVSGKNQLKVTSFFKEEYFGLTGVYEILATK